MAAEDPSSDAALFDYTTHLGVVAECKEDMDNHDV